MLCFLMGAKLGLFAVGWEWRYSSLALNHLSRSFPDNSTNTKRQENVPWPCIMNSARHLLLILDRNQRHLWFIFPTSEVCFFFKAFWWCRPQCYRRRAAKRRRFDHVWSRCLQRRLASQHLLCKLTWTCRSTLNVFFMVKLPVAAAALAYILRNKK